ncbi:MAG: TetR/AcrR family transcriptional regulator [Pseudonocardiales bacterium]|nr:TetR/AcrR family transcriptional regulator [Pseudonocardiales bacterium]
MSPALTAVHPETSRGRRTSRPSGDERQMAILATAERLLADRTLREISINDLARGAGISRTAFYFYFASKDAVLLALLDSVVNEALTAHGDVLDHLAEDPRARWREAIKAFYKTFRSHRAVILACWQVVRTNAEIRRLRDTVMEGRVQATATAIEAERARGAAPAGLPARDLAVALNSMYERVMLGTVADEGPALADSDVVDVLVEVCLMSIYQTTSPC